MVSLRSAIKSEIKEDNILVTSHQRVKTIFSPFLEILKNIVPTLKFLICVTRFVNIILLPRSTCHNLLFSAAISVSQWLSASPFLERRTSGEIRNGHDSELFR